MKKFLVFLICGIVSSTAFAQEKIAKSGWYAQVLLGVDNTGTDNMSLGTLKHNVGVNGSLEGGYVFNPYLSLGLQAEYDRLNMKKSNGERRGFNALEPSLNLYWDLTNTFLGYIPNRKNHVRLFAGGSAAFSFGLPFDFESEIQNTNNYGVFGYRGGLQYERNLGRNWAFDANAVINVMGDKLDSHEGGGSDSHLNIQVGIRKYFGLGKVRKNRGSYIEAITNYIEKRDTVIIPEIVEVPAPKDVYSIFFNIDKIDIRPTEVSKIQAVADFLKAHPEKVVFIFGYADRNTGTTARNNWLAKNRARVITEQLIQTYGIAPERIISHDQGDRVQPFTEEEYEKNRSTICVITDLVR